MSTAFPRFDGVITWRDKTALSRFGLAVACIGLMTLSACGGGSSGSGNNSGGGSSGTTAPPVADAASTKMDVKVVDAAPVANATVFLDKNNNGVLDADEATAKTNASGVASLDVPNDDVGKSPMVALVGTDATEAGVAVPIAFTMRAPADSTGVVSPLTTLVQRVVDDTGVTTAQAESAMKSQTPLAASMLADYTADASPEGKTAASTAQLVAAAMRQQLAALAGAVGTTDLSGATITAVDLDKVIQESFVQAFAGVVGAAQSQAVQDACAVSTSNSCQTALEAQATQINASSGLTVASLPVAVGTSRSTDQGSSGTAASGNLGFMNFGDAGNWYYRVFISSPDENTPDAQGLTHYRTIARAMSGGTLYEWGTAGNYANRTDQHWNGTAWVGCPLGLEMAQTPRDASGYVAYNDYCDGLQTSSSRRTYLDISGRGMTEIATAIRNSLPGFANWGGPPSGYTGGGVPDYGTAVFPAGSKLLSQFSTATATAVNYDVNSPLLRYPSSVTAGGDARGNPGSICNNTPAQNIVIQSLEEMMSNYQGKPCIYDQNSFTSSASATPLTSLSPDEWWSNSTLSIGVVGTDALVANPTSFFTANTIVRVGFSGGGNAVTYYTCLQRQVNGSSRNCTVVGAGTFAIATQGDARVLSFTNLPAAAAPLDYERVFVERGGTVYYGSLGKKGSSQAMRLNLTAANALFTQIGIPPVTP